MLGLSLTPPQCDIEDELASSSYYNTLFLLTGLAGALYAFVKLAESSNRLDYDTRFARVISGILMLMMRMLHTRSGDLEINNPESTLIAIGPHRTGWDALVVTSKITGTPPRFFVTDSFDSVPGVSALLKMSKAIPIAAHGSRGENGRSANADALDHASKVLSEKGCVAIFPQGNLSKLNEDPHKIYSGAAILALRNKIPIQVIRLDGFWCLQNPLIPIVIRNHTLYRIFFSMLHMNHVRATLCCEIDVHLQPENEGLSDEEKIEEISAQLYAYYRHTADLTVDQIDSIKPEISNKTHLLIWGNKVKQDELGKQLVKLKEEEASLGAPTLASLS